MKNLFIILSIFFFHNPLMYSQDLIWAKKLGDLFVDEANSATVDANGNVYTTGFFQGTPDFDPGSGIFNLNSTGGLDVFIQKLDASGNFVWAKQLGGTSSDNANSITVDASGNVYTIGYFSGTADFDPGSGTFNLTSAGGLDVFISKLDASGNFVWAKQLGGSATERGNAINVDAIGNVYATGYFGATVDFDPGSGTFNLTSAGGSDIFVLKLNTDGNFIWAKQFSGTGVGNLANSIAIDGNGNVYTTGEFSGTTDFDPGSGTYNLVSIGSYSVFISKLNSSGDFVWAKKIGGSTNDSGYSITTDNTGNVYTTGVFRGTADFDPESAAFNLTSNGDRDVFISKLDALGNFVWARQMGGTGADYGKSIALDAIGNVYTTGSFQGTADFDPNGNTFNLTSIGSDDLFLSKFDNSGNFLWTKRFGDTDSDVANSITADPIGNLYVTGFFQRTVDFDHSSNTFYLSSFGNGRDVFTLKLKSCANSSSLINVTACDTYTSPSGKVFTATNIYADTIPNAANCDSIITINLTIKNSTNSLINVTACDTYISPSGKVFTTTDTYADTIPNAANCDSIITINLTIKNSTSSAINVTACDTYISPSGKVFTTSDTYADTIQNTVNCDSIITINLTINTVDVTLTNNSPTLIANNTSANTYQWIDCTTDLLLNGETAATYEAISNGDYAVIITENGCTDTSNCITINNVSLDDLAKAEEIIKIYPNPTNGWVHIKSLSKLETIEIFDLQGHRLLRKTNELTILNLSQLPKGMYLMQVVFENGTGIVKRLEKIN